MEVVLKLILQNKLINKYAYVPYIVVVAFVVVGVVVVVISVVFVVDPDVVIVVVEAIANLDFNMCFV